MSQGIEVAKIGPEKEEFLDAQVEARRGQFARTIIGVVPRMTVILIILSFKVRRILREHLEGHREEAEGKIELSGLATFFFQIYYLQYRINRL